MKPRKQPDGVATAAIGRRTRSGNAAAGRAHTGRHVRNGLLAGLMAGAWSAGAAFAAGPADAPACGSLHTVMRGETLFLVAERAYGDGWKYREIFRANRDLLPDEASVEIGDALLIPCLDGTGPRTRRELMSSAPATDLAAAGDRAERRDGPALLPEAAAERAAAGRRGASCASVHRVKRGETLFLIAQRAYGDGWKYREIFAANRDLLPDERSVEVGQELLIPCADGSGPRDRREAAAAGLLLMPSEPDLASVAAVAAPPAVPAIDGTGFSAVAAADAPLPAHPASLLAGIPVPPAPQPARAVLAPVAQAAAPAGAAAAAGGCASVHRVKRGETLFLIAQRAYGDGWKYRGIFAANRDLLPDERSVEVGQELLIPCADGSGPRDRREAAAAGLLLMPSEPDPAIVAAVAELALPVLTDLPPGLAGLEPRDAVPGRAIEPAPRAPAAPEAEPAAAAQDSAPETAQASDATLPAEPAPGTAIRLLARAEPADRSGGEAPGDVVSGLVVAAMAAASPEREIVLAAVAGRAAFPRLLVDQRSFDIAFPWFMPDCADTGRLTLQTRALCAEFEFSRPLAEVPVAFFARRGDAWVRAAASVADLAGRTVCRPAAQFAGDLDLGLLAGTGVAIRTASSAHACFGALVAGEVDSVMLIGNDSGDEIRQLQQDYGIDPVAALGSVETLHAIVPRSNPFGRAYLDLVNRGLEEIMRSGKWFEVFSGQKSRDELSG